MLAKVADRFIKSQQPIIVRNARYDEIFIITIASRDRYSLFTANGGVFDRGDLDFIAIAESAHSFIVTIDDCLIEVVDHTDGQVDFDNVARIALAEDCTYVRLVKSDNGFAAKLYHRDPKRGFVKRVELPKNDLPEEESKSLFLERIDNQKIAPVKVVNGQLETYAEYKDRLAQEEITTMFAYKSLYQRIFDSNLELIDHYRDAMRESDNALHNLRLFANGHKYTEVSSEVWGILQGDYGRTMAICDAIGTKLLNLCHDAYRPIEDSYIYADRDMDRFWDMVTEYINQEEIKR